MRQAAAEELGNRNATLELVAWLKDNTETRPMPYMPGRQA